MFLNWLTIFQSMTRYVFLSHDVDWKFSGPSKKHILERRDRFDKSVLDNLDIVNPYNNFNQIMTIEEKYGCHSTFFFRTKYEDGDFREYENQICELEQGGWEIGLHLDPSSIYDISNITKEYDDLSSITKNKILGNRVHYLNYDDSLLPKLKKLGLKYDSSLKFSKSKLVDADFGFYRKDILQFPVTIMDAYLFTYMGITEKNILSFFEQVIKKDTLFTIVWHDNVLRMKGGRMYADVIKYLHSNDVVFCTGNEICDLIENHEYFL